MLSLRDSNVLTKSQTKQVVKYIYCAIVSMFISEKFMAQQDYLDAMRSLFSSDQEVQEFLASMHKPLKKTIKILGSRMPMEKFVAQTKEWGWKLTPTQFDAFADMYYIDREDLTLPLGKEFLHLLGFFYMQELAASTSPHFMDIPYDGLVLDMCASPGGKTVQLADYALAG